MIRIFAHSGDFLRERKFAHLDATAAIFATLGMKYMGERKRKPSWRIKLVQSYSIF